MRRLWLIGLMGIGAGLAWRLCEANGPSGATTLPLSNLTEASNVGVTFAAAVGSDIFLTVVNGFLRPVTRTVSRCVRARRSGRAGSSECSRYSSPLTSVPRSRRAPTPCASR